MPLPFAAVARPASVQRLGVLAGFCLGVAVALSPSCGPTRTCDASSCAGCCSGDLCMSGTTAGSCGTGGEACFTCTGGLTCARGTCAPPPTGFTGGAGGAGGSVDAGAGAPFNEPFETTSWTPAPISGGTLELVGDVLAVAVDPDRERVFVVDLAVGAVKHTVVFPKDSRPMRAVADASGTVHVLLRGPGAVARVDAQAGAVLRTDAVCPEPRGLGVHGPTQDVFVACRGGELVRLSPSGVAHVTRLGDDLRDVLVEDGRLAVTTFKTATLQRATDLEGTAGVTLSPPPLLAEAQAEVAWRTRATPVGPMMLHQRASVTSINTQGHGAAGASAYGSPAPDSCGRSVVRAALTLFDEARPTLSMELPDVLAVDFAVATLPAPNSCVGAGCPRMAIALVASAGGTGASFYALPEALLAGGQQGGCLRPYRNIPGQFTGARFRADGTAVLHDRRPGALVIATSDTVRTIALASDSVDSAGSRLFHVAPRGGAPLSCASCHPEGLEDGHTWRIDGELRRTQSLAGGVSARAPFHWAGDLPTLDALMGDTFVRRMGGGAPPAAFVDSLAAWLDTVPAPRASPTVDAATLARGRAAFEKAGCAGCHAGPQLTNNTPSYVGGANGKVFKTPTLVGLHARGPWMHDGCAKTLAERFSNPACGGWQHGDLSGLSVVELGALLSYLSSL